MNVKDIITGRVIAEADLAVSNFRFNRWQRKTEKEQANRQAQFNADFEDFKKRTSI